MAVSDDALQQNEGSRAARPEPLPFLLFMCPVATTSATHQAHKFSSLLPHIDLTTASSKEPMNPAYDPRLCLYIPSRMCREAPRHGPGSVHCRVAEPVHPSPSRMAGVWREPSPRVPPEARPNVGLAARVRETSQLFTRPAARALRHAPCGTRPAARALRHAPCGTRPAARALLTPLSDGECYRWRWIRRFVAALLGGQRPTANR